MKSTEATGQDEFKELLGAHFSSRRESGNLRSKWPDKIVAKFGELFRAGHGASFFEETYGLANNQYHSLRLRLKVKKPPKAGSFQRLKVEKPKPEAPAIPLLDYSKSEFYLRSRCGVELRGLDDLQTAVEVFVKVLR